MHLTLTNQHYERNPHESSVQKLYYGKYDEMKISKKLTLLIVENDKKSLAYLYKELKNEYNIFRTNDSFEALKTLSSHEIDFVLANAKSTYSNSDNICQKVKSSSIYSHIPVLLVIDPEDINSKINSLKNGADAYIDYPITIQQLNAHIQNIIFNREIVKNNLSPNQCMELNHFDLSNNFISMVYTTIEKGISDTNFTVDELAKLMNMSRATLYRKLKKFSDNKPHELIIKLKLNIALKLLSKGIYSVSQVATMVGYSLQSNFSRDFRKYFGVRPSIYLAK